MRSRRLARETALQTLYSCDTLGDFAKERIANYFKHYYNFEFDAAQIDREAAITFVSNRQEVVESELSESSQSDSDEFHTESNRDQANNLFAVNLAIGVAEHLSQIDETIESASEHWSLARMSRVDRNILRIATFELAFQTEIPLNVIINEAIEISKRFGGNESPHFVNGVLDKVAQLVRPASSSKQAQ